MNNYGEDYFKNTSWRFVTRRFANIYIHEKGFFYLGEEKENGNVRRWEANYVTSLVIDGKANLMMGLPKPKPAGYTYGGHKEVVQNIYCDSFFLCPDCGRFYFHDKDRFTFLRYFGVNDIRKQDIISLFEEKKNNKEFEILECKTKICLSEKDKNLQLKFSSQDKDTRLDALTNAMEGYYTDGISNVSETAVNSKGFIYIIQADEYVKIGIADDVKNRVKQIQSTCPIKLKVINFWKISKASYYENLLHKRYRNYRVHGEWFALPADELAFLSKATDIEEALKRANE